MLCAFAQRYVLGMVCVPTNQKEEAQHSHGTGWGRTLARAASSKGNGMKVELVLLTMVKAGLRRLELSPSSSAMYRKEAHAYLQHTDLSSNVKITMFGNQSKITRPTKKQKTTERGEKSTDRNRPRKISRQGY